VNNTYKPEIAIYLTRGSAGCKLAVELNAVTIVVDALRASTTIAALFAAGAKEILVVADESDARNAAEKYPDALLIGERGGLKLPGFDIGNSPQEVTAYGDFTGKTIIFTSSNGAQRLTACRGAGTIAIGSVANLCAISTWAQNESMRLQRSVVLISAGKFPDEDFVSPEDDASCACIAGEISLPIHSDMSDEYKLMCEDIKNNGLEQIFNSSKHAHLLYDIGYGPDVAFCSQKDTFSVVPVVAGDAAIDGRIIGVRLVNKVIKPQQC
jgi:2-phosphosulfolactate phosphatase